MQHFAAEQPHDIGEGSTSPAVGSKTIAVGSAMNTQEHEDAVEALGYIRNVYKCVYMYIYIYMLTHPPMIHIFLEFCCSICT